MFKVFFFVLAGVLCVDAQETLLTTVESESSCDQLSSTSPAATQSCGKTVLQILSSTSSAKTDLVAPKPQKKENKPKMQMEWSDFFGGLAEGGNYVIRDTESWKNLWIRVRDGEAPDVDFSKQMALAVFMGMKPTGGYSIKITKIEKAKKELRVFVQESKPPKRAFVIQAFTSPYHIKLVEKSDLPLEFKKIK